MSHEADGEGNRALLERYAGLRRGEIMALEWTDVDLPRGPLTVERSEWKGKIKRRRA